MPLPLVSVIVPVYNGEKYLDATLKSILNQDYQPLEIIVVNDGSSDNSGQIAQSYPSIRYLYQLNQGQGAAMNAGLDIATGSLITFLDADDLWVPHNLTQQVNYLLEHPDVDMVLAGIKNFADEDARIPHRNTEDLARDETVTIILGALLAHRRVFKQIGQFDNDYKNAKDFDWFFRAREANINMQITPDVILLRRLHENNRSYATRQRKTDLLRAVKSSIARKRALANDSSH